MRCQLIFKKSFLTTEEFFTIVIWKSNRTKTKVLRGIKKEGRTVKQIMSGVKKENNHKKKVEMLYKIPGIGIPIASAILAVCYPKTFTIADYRTAQTIKSKRMGRNFKGNPTSSISAYLEYSKTCCEIAKEKGLSLRDTDRALWSFDFYEGKGGLKELVNNLT